MTNAELLTAGVNLMLLGMGFVFGLLGLLVVTVGVMSRLARKLEGEPRPVELPAEPAKPRDGELLSAISAAVHRYRRSRGNKK
ncbi:MAG: OadG family protein [Chromatiaceae bacterium]|nr:OadG family protein [Chromatiaceae bacterium]